MNGQDRPESLRADGSAESGVPVVLSPRLYRRLEALSLRLERTVEELIEDAVEMQYGEASVNARFRVVANLARLEADLGEPSSLTGDLMDALRTYRGVDR